MTLLDIWRLAGLIFGIVFGIQLGAHFKILGQIFGGLIGGFVAVNVGQVLVELISRLADRFFPQPSLINKIQLSPQHEIEQVAIVKSREIKARWIIPIAVGMFTVVGLIGAAIYRDFSLLWNCFLLLLATLAILIVGGFMLVTSLWICQLLVMPTIWLFSKGLRTEGKVKIELPQGGSPKLKRRLTHPENVSSPDWHRTVLKDVSQRWSPAQQSFSPSKN